MSIQSQNLNKINILITGGEGDLAKSITDSLDENYHVLLPSKVELDVSSIDSVESYFKNKQIDIVVNAAGTLYSSLVLDSNPIEWIRDIEVNLIGTYLICRKVLLINEKALVINIASTAAYNHYSDWTSYCSSKAGVMKLSGGLFLNGFDVITMCPGAIETKIRKNLEIINPNTMSIEEGAAPILSAINRKYKSGDVVFYRKNEIEIKNY